MAVEDPGDSLSERNIKLVVEYDGALYAGWQKQKDNLPTVQGELVEAIEKVVNHPVIVRGAGRTDRGVHALGQVANFHTPRRIPVRNLLMAINTYLPVDIAVKRVEEVSEDFDARRSALGKHYRYTVFRSPVRSAFALRWSKRVYTHLDVEAMRDGASCLVGHHDFKAFSKRSSHPPPTTDRTVYAVELVEASPFLFIDVVGHGFLHNMVRTIAGTLLEVGRGRTSPESVEEALRSRDRRRAGPTAEAQGLCLVEVIYDRERMEHVLSALKDPQGAGALFARWLIGLGNAPLR